MKKLILILGLCLPVAAIGQAKQSKDSLNAQQIEHMKNCLQRAHDVYRNGLKISAVGFGLMTIGSIGVITNRPEYENPTRGFLPLGLGAAVSFVGRVVMIYSHKHIGNAGLSFDGGVVYRF